MILYAVAVWDSALQAFNRPFWSNSRGVAIRSFIDEVKRPHSTQEPNPFKQHPYDFELHQLFEFDDNTGLVTNNAPEVLMRGKDVDQS